MLLQLEKITKQYGSLTANRGVDFDLREGEVHALVGENGAGKTTLMRILYGMEQPTSGTIRVRGDTRVFASPSDAMRAGIGMVHQHFMLFPSFTAAENIVIGNEPKSRVRFHRREAAAAVDELCRKYGMPVDPWAVVGECSLGMQQRVEILKVLHQGAEIIILDEPTGVLTPLEVKSFLQEVKQLARLGKSFILITHKLNEVMDVADRITVLRDGQVVATVAAGETDIEGLSRLMVGRELAEPRRNPTAPGEAVLEAERLTIARKHGKPILDEVSLKVRKNEIVGIAGISGNGQSELIQAITGLRSVDHGTIKLCGTDVTRSGVQYKRETGLAHIPEDRYLWGAAKEATVSENALMGHHRRLQRRGLIRAGAVREMVESWIRRFDIKAGTLETKSQYLSGGNLQKLIVARELAQGTPFLLAAEPTRGVDIGAMEKIHEELVNRRDEGGAILLVSSELTEIMKLSDRILVMYEGKIVGEMAREEATEEKISLLMAGGIGK
jgi:general nucleoside transport system ATP-binding protein